MSTGIQTRFLYQMMFVSFSNTTTGGNSGTGTAYPTGATLVKARFLMGFEILCCSIFSFLCSVLFTSLLFFSLFVFRPLFRLSVFHLQRLIIPYTY